MLDCAAPLPPQSQDGALRIGTETGKVIHPESEPEREGIGEPVGYDQINISYDGRTVGWVALYRNCCMSYHIPLALVVYSDGIKRSYTGNGLPVWRWRFLAAGTQLEFRQETVHGGMGVNFELRDFRTGELIAYYRPEVGPANHPLPSQQVPEWVSALNAAR